MSTRVLDPQENYGLQSMTIPTIAGIGDILQTVTSSGSC